MKRNAREREHELRFASVLDLDTGGFLSLMRPVFRRIVRRAVKNEYFLDCSLLINIFFFKNVEGDETDDDDDDDDDDEISGHSRHMYSFDCTPS